MVLLRLNNRLREIIYISVYIVLYDGYCHSVIIVIGQKMLGKNLAVFVRKTKMLRLREVLRNGSCNFIYDSRGHCYTTAGAGMGKTQTDFVEGERVNRQMLGIIEILGKQCLCINFVLLIAYF